MNPEIVGKVDSSFLFSYKKELDEAFLKLSRGY